MGVVRKFRGRAARQTGAAPSPDQFPHLLNFLSGYLHQDFVLDHKTPARALEAFLADAGADERAALRDEWRRFRAAIDGRLWRDVRETFAALGGAWRPGSRAALLDLFAVLEKGTDDYGRWR